jgi:cytochrome c553
VPPGSIAKGEALVKNGACATCHGEALKGKGEVPRLAGIQPLTIARQLYLIKHGSSNGAGVAPVKPVVTKMTDEEIISDLVVSGIAAAGVETSARSNADRGRGATAPPILLRCWRRKERARTSRLQQRRAVAPR